MFDKIQKSIQYIRTITDFSPKFGIILGTGLGDLANQIEDTIEIPYGDIPHFPTSTVESHSGKLIFGWLAGFPIVAMAGRFHYYEGYSAKELTFPIRVLKYLDIELLFISNVSGGVNPDYKAGDVIFVKDHIFLQPENPLRGGNDERLGVRFPDMSNTYNLDLIQKGLAVAKKNNISAHSGVYVCLQGPNLETPGEYVFANRIGGDVVGMSTIPEVIVAKHSELPVFVLSIVSNQSYPPEAIKETSLEDVIKMAKEVEPKMTIIIKEMLKIAGN